MNVKRKDRSRGQILVIVVFMLVGLLAMLALVLDGGNLYTQRRQAQLAADAGALAGARARCDPDVTASPESEAESYVNSNDADMVSFTLGPGEYEVTVEAGVTFDTFFLGILGRPEMTATALAAAKCETGGGASVLPVAWSCRPPDFDYYNGEPGPGCDLDLDPDDSTCTYPSEALGNPDEWDKFYIIFDSESMETVIYCAENNHPEYGTESWPGFTCDACDNPELLSGDQLAYCESDYPKCDLNCDGVTDIEILNQSSYGWLDLDGGGSDANELRQWVLGEGDPYVEIHRWYAGKPGMATTVLDAVGDELIDENVVVPVFNEFCSKEFGVPSETNNNCAWHPRDGDGKDEVVLSGISDDYFHIIGFANYKVTCVEGGSHGPCEIHDLLVDKGVMAKNTKSIEGCFIQGVDPDITGYGGEDFEAYTLRLSR